MDVKCLRCNEVEPPINKNGDRLAYCNDCYQKMMRSYKSSAESETDNIMGDLQQIRMLLIDARLEVARLRRILEMKHG